MKKCLDANKKDIKENIMMQKLLSELSDVTLASTIEKIQSSIFCEDIKRMRVLLTSIGIFIKIRREQITCFFQIIDNIMPKITQFFNKEEIMSLFKRKEIHLKFLKDGFLTIHDIASFYGLKNPKLAFFYPEFLNFPNEYPTVIQDSKQSQKHRDVIEYFTTHKSINDDPRMSAGNFDTLSLIIQKDDIENFQKFVSHNDIKIQSHKIEITSFESNKCLNQTSVYLIEYAAYHCSLKIFKFLMMNNAAFSKNLLRYSICGGNNEIIHMSESATNEISLHKDQNDILSMSIAFHRYSITEYLVDSCNISIEYNDFLNSILACNYFFFFNHITECHNEYNRLFKLRKVNELSDEDDFKYNELKDKANELALIASQNVDVFFLKVISCFSEIDLNLTGSYGLNQKKITCPLVMAIQSRNVENVKFLLSLDSVDPDWKVINDTTPFLWACYIGNLEIVKYLIDNFYFKKNSTENNINEKSEDNENSNNENTNINTNENSTNTNIKIDENENITNENTNLNTNENSTDKNIKINANDNSSSENMNLNPEESNESYELILSEHSSYESCEFLDIKKEICKKRTINIMQTVEQSGENALHLATRKCHLDVVKYLVSLNVYDLSAQNSQGETCIQTAARLGYKEIFEFLKFAMIESGLKIDENIKVNEQKYLPQLHIKPLAMGLNLFESLKDPIPICLLI